MHFLSKKPYIFQALKLLSVVLIVSIRNYKSYHWQVLIIRKAEQYPPFFREKIILLLIMSWPNTYPSSWPHTTQVLRDTQPNCLLLLHNCYNHHTHSHNYGHHNHHYGFTKTQPASHFVIMKSPIQRQCICICIDRRCICILRIRKATRLGNISISLPIFWPSFDRLPNPRQCRRSF